MDVTEHSTTIKAELPARDVNKKMKVFYNPLMTSNRNISILLLNTIKNKNLRIADLLAGSGIRSLRFFKELEKGKVAELHVNDSKENFPEVFKENLQLNKIKPKNLFIRNEDAHLFLLHSRGFDYIDIDPFGSPNPFLSAAIMRIKRQGILAITATDTAALTGTYPKVTKRKYWATPLRNYLMHETGLRILIRKVQLLGVQFDKALTPVLSYHKDHYFRVYFRSEKGKEKCDEIVQQHQYLLFNPLTLEYKISVYNQEKGFQFAGPLWVGRLFDQKLARKMAKTNLFPEEQKFLDLLEKESTVDVIGFIDLHVLAKLKKEEPPKIEEFIRKAGGVRTHFSTYGVRVQNPSIIIK